MLVGLALWKSVIKKSLRMIEITWSTVKKFSKRGEIETVQVVIGAARSAPPVRFGVSDRICWRRLTDYRRRKEAHREETANMGKSQSKLAKYDTPVFCQIKKLYGQKCMQDMGKLIR